MAVEKDMLFAVMQAILRKRNAQGFETDTQALRMILEYGHSSGEALASNEGLVGNGSWISRSAQVQPSCWINLRGKCFWIDYAHHSAFSRMLVGEGTQRLEAEGWIHVSDKGIDLLMGPTPAQRVTMDELCQQGFRERNASMLQGRRPDVALHPALNMGHRPDYQWDDPRYWEARGIPRSGHCPWGPVAEKHIRDWQEAQRNYIYAEPARFNPAYVPHAQQFDQYVSQKAFEFYTAQQAASQGEAQ